MALGTLTAVDSAGLQASSPTYLNSVSFAGISYLTGGMSGLQTKLATLVGDGRTIVTLIAGDCGGYVPCWIPATGKVMVYYGDDNNASDGPMIEVPNATDLSAVTFNVVVVSQ